VLHHQSSETFSKTEHTKGHHFGIVGVIGGNNEKQSCIPIVVKLQEGIDELRPIKSQNQGEDNLDTKNG